MEEDIIHYTDGKMSCGEGKEFFFHWNIKKVLEFLHFFSHDQVSEKYC